MARLASAEYGVTAAATDALSRLASAEYGAALTAAATAAAAAAARSQPAIVIYKNYIKYFSVC